MPNTNVAELIKSIEDKTLTKLDLSTNWILDLTKEPINRSNDINQKELNLLKSFHISHVNSVDIGSPYQDFLITSETKLSNGDIWYVSRPAQEQKLLYRDKDYNQIKGYPHTVYNPTKKQSIRVDERAFVFPLVELSNHTFAFCWQRYSDQKCMIEIYDFDGKRLREIPYSSQTSSYFTYAALSNGNLAIYNGFNMEIWDTINGVLIGNDYPIREIGHIKHMKMLTDNFLILLGVQSIAILDIHNKKIINQLNLQISWGYVDSFNLSEDCFVLINKVSTYFHIISWNTSTNIYQVKDFPVSHDPKIESKFPILKGVFTDESTLLCALPGGGTFKFSLPTRSLKHSDIEKLLLTLKNNSSVEQINLHSVNLHDEALNYLLDIINTNTKLVHLDLRKTKLSIYAQRELEALCKNKSNIRTLYLDNITLDKNKSNVISPIAFKDTLKQKFNANPIHGSKDNHQIKIPHVYICPLTHQIMFDPVMAADGHTYERDAIQAALKIKLVSPLTNEALEHGQVISNHSMRSTIIELLIQHPELWQENNIHGEAVYFSTELQQQAITALLENNLDLLKRCLERDHRILTHETKYNTSNFLALVCQQGSLEALKIVLNVMKESDLLIILEQTDETGLFQLCAQYIGPEAAKLLSQSFNWTIAHYEEQAYKAIEQGDIKTLSACLMLGLPINTRHAEKGSLLHQAAKCGQTEVAIYLIQAGADPKLRNDRDQKPVQVAKGAGHEETLQAIETEQLKAKLALLNLNSNNRDVSTSSALQIKQMQEQMAQMNQLIQQLQSEVTSLKNRLEAASTNNLPLLGSQLPTYSATPETDSSHNSYPTKFFRH